MKRFLSFFGFLIVFSIFAQGEILEDKTLSPYFFVKSDDPEIDQMPLKSTNVSVKIAGVIADVEVKQIYKNEGKRPIEAIYVFPGSTRAAVYGMKMKIGERTIIAKIKERDEARKVYEKARKEGRTASLLEQQRPNVFQMNVSNIMPQDVIEVELKYTELLIPEEKIYEFVYPTVVGPRYSNIPESKAPPSENWIKSPYFHENEPPSYSFHINTIISAGLPIKEISCTSHKVDVDFINPNTASVKLKESEKYSGNKDFILKYKLSGKKIENGLLLYESAGEKFFLLMVQPPERILKSQIPNREYIFIMDVSGSMYGFPIEISKKVIKDILSGLRQSDKFNILLFSGSSYVLSEKSIPATSENIRKAIALIDAQKGGGGTELLPALKKALTLPRDENLSTTIVILTDGYVTVEKEAFDIIRNNLNKANLFSFGIGTSVNRFIIEGMAHAGMAESFIVTKLEEAEFISNRFKEIVSNPTLTDIKVDFLGFDVYDVVPPSIPDLFLEKPIIVFGKFKGNPDGVIEIKGVNGSGVFKENINVYEEKPSKVNLALKYLWARHKIQILSDYSSLERNEENKNEIINLGLKYNLLTQFTSFIAEDSLVRNKEGISETVNQPLPLPEGVSNYALPSLDKCLAPSEPAPLLIKAEKKFLESIEEMKKVEVFNKKMVSIIRISSSDKLIEENIKNILNKNLTSLNNCNLKNYKGRIDLEIKIGLNGKVENAKILYNEVGTKMGNCVLEKIKSFIFNLNLKKPIKVNIILGFYV